MREVFVYIKSQFISKANCQADEQINSFLQICNVFLFVFLEEIEDSKKTFEITWPLDGKKLWWKMWEEVTFIRPVRKIGT